MSVTELRRCRPAHDRPTCPEWGCVYGDPDRSRARAGRVKLRADLTASAADGAGSGCRCARCEARNAPLGDIEADLALRHVSDRDAVLYAVGAVVLGGMVDCERCRAWVPSFHPVSASVAASTDGGGCPFHC